LVLMVRLTLSVVNHVVTENVQGFVADLRFCTITDKLAHGSPFSDVVFQRGNKFAVRLNPIGIGDQTLGAGEDLAHVEPLSTAGVSEKMVSVATGSLRW